MVAAALNVFPLSETNFLGNPRRAENLFNTLMNVGAARSVTISKCTALVVQHVNKPIQTLLDWSFLTLTNRGPAKSTSTTVKGGDS